MKINSLQYKKWIYKILSIFVTLVGTSRRFAILFFIFNHRLRSLWTVGHFTQAVHHERKSYSHEKRDKLRRKLRTKTREPHRACKLVFKQSSELVGCMATSRVLAWSWISSSGWKDYDEMIIILQVADGSIARSLFNHRWSNEKRIHVWN